MASNTDHPATKHVKRNFFLISCIVLCEPISSTMLLPFVFFMVKGFGYAEAEIGSRAGIITSCFFIVQMFSTPFWSLWSNKVGRKPTLLTGLFFTAFGMVLFGLSESLAWAIAARCFCGLMNGNFPVARTMVGELAELSGTDRGKAFSLFGFCLAAGWLIGPMVGGALTRPATHLDLSGPKEVFVRFPYLLPCLCATLINLTVFIASWYLLEDTKPRSTDNYGDPQFQPTDADPLLETGQGGGIDGAESAARVNGPMVEQAKVQNRRVQIMCLVSALFFFVHAILFDELFSLFAASSVEAGTGLSFQPQDIASALIASGPAMFLALLVFPFAYKHVTALKLYRVSAFSFVVIYPLFSLLPRIKHLGTAWLWISLVTLVMLRYASLVISLTSLNILFNDFVIPQERALMNGIGQSVGSLARTVGPTLGGCVWSWSLSNKLAAPLDFHASFVLLASLSAAQGVITLLASGE